MKTRSITQKRKQQYTFEDDTRATAQAIIALARIRNDAEEFVLQLLRDYAARVRKNRGSTTQAQKTGTTTHPAQRGDKQRTQQGATKHICDRCRHKYLEMVMQQVSLYDGEYTMWTADRAAYFRSHSLKYPALVWLCGSCYSAAQQAQAEEWRTGEPVPTPAAKSPRSRKAQK
jgi:hypothetical protein